MKRDHDGCVRGFYRLSQAYWAQAGKPEVEIMVGLYHTGGGTTGEFAVRWVEFCDKFSPRLEVFDDAWSALRHFDDLLAAMAERDSEDITPDQFSTMALDLGLVDRTERVSP